MTRCAVFAAALLLTAGATAQDKADDQKKLDGAWVLTSGENDGKAVAAEALKTGRLVFDGDKHVVTVGGAVYKGTQKLDPAAKPKAIDITDTEGPFKGKTILGIYDVTGDTFKICYDPSGKARPKEFTGKAGSGFINHVWTREKK